MKSVSKNPLKIKKWKIAQLLDISESTLSRLFNVIYFEELKEKGYTKRQHYVYRHQLDIVFPEGLDFDDTSN